MEFCVYGEFTDEVRGVEEVPANNLWGETLYYNVPLEPASSGSYFPYLNGDINVYNSGYYQEPSYPVYYPLINEYSPDNFYYSYYAFVPVYCYYFVPNDNYYLPRSEYVVSSSNSFEQGPFYESPLMSPTEESNLFTYGEYDSSIYHIQNGSFNDGSVEEIVGEAITTCYFSYVEYPEISDEAANDDEEESASSDENLEENIVPNGADINDVTIVGQHNEQPHDVYVNICDEDVDENVIKKVSLMSIAEVQQDIDDTYEYGKANLYNEVLKGYTENKCTLEELEWECHSLDDIPEEEEPEDDSDEMDFDENVLKNYKNLNLKEDFNKNCFSDVEEESNFVSESLSEESIMASSEDALVENCPIMMEGNQASMDSSIVAENSKTDPCLERSIRNDKLYMESINGIEEPSPPVDSAVPEENYKNVSVPDTCLGKQEIDSRAAGIIEDHNPTVDSAVVAESHKINAISDVCANKEIDSGTESGIESIHPSMDSTITKENHKTNSIQDPCLSKEEMDSVCLGNSQEPYGNVSSEDRGEEAPVILAPAASEKKKRKKRFSSLRKFFARICCCGKKQS